MKEGIKEPVDEFQEEPDPSPNYTTTYYVNTPNHSFNSQKGCDT